MRLATWNVEWFTALFDDDNRPIEDDTPSARYNVSKRAQLLGIGRVLAALDADAVLIVEAPDEGRRRSTVEALEGFADACGLRTRRATIGFASHTEQEIALLYDPDAMMVRHDPQGSASVPRFDGTMEVSLGNGAGSERAQFSKPPLELAVTPATGAPFRLIGVHAKSKAPHGARSAEQVHQITLENRRKQLAQCQWLRLRVEDHLRRGDRLVVLGDLNDGPGLDSFEGPFGRSGVEVVMGLDGDPALRLCDPHAIAALRHPLSGGHSTARFYHAGERRFFPALLDYVLVSPDLAAQGPRWRIWHPFDDPECWSTPDLRQALLDASDHFPVTLDFTP
ncbi:MAG: endonuclease/exonuclease/phosphatase family protein [Gemmobacter sp.]|uniref:endonuclease/exonuclease/phosphatase family protein n=1 Tax=Gemmobacter sp. TaxID=1898957 RepID=UPI0039188D20